MSSPSSPIIQVNGENALLQPPTSSRETSYAPRSPSPANSYHSPAVRNPFHGLPLSTAGESAACGTNASRDPGGNGPYPDEYDIGSANELLDTWRLCRGALYFFRTERVLPNVLRGYAAQLFSMATNEGPLGSLEEAEREADDYGSVVGALRAYREELIDYIPADEYLIGQAHPAPEDLPRPSPSQEDTALQSRSPTPSNTAAAVLLQQLSHSGHFGGYPGGHGRDLGEGPNDQDAEMRRNGWVEYDHSNPLHHEIQYADPLADDTYHTCRWFRVDVTHEQTWLEGADGPRQQIYCRILHARPRRGPTDTEPRMFRDDILQIFNPEHSARNIIDRSINRIADEGLRADVRRLRVLHHEQSTLLATLQRTNNQIRANQEETILIARFLVQARAASQVGLNVIGHPQTTNNAATSRRDASPAPTHRGIPPIIASQGPNDGQFTTALGKRDRASGQRAHYHHCLKCNKFEDHSQGCPHRCCYCSHNHDNDLCEEPHIRCSWYHCHVPWSHPSHGLICPAAILGKVEDGMDLDSNDEWESGEELA